MTEAVYQSKLKKKIEKMYPGCYVMKNDPSSFQGVPDLTILYKDRWATLEVKENAVATHRPNQDRYVDDMNNKSFSAFIYPENEKEVLDAMERSFKAKR